MNCVWSMLPESEESKKVEGEVWEGIKWPQV